MWNIYIFGLLFLYAPSHKTWGNEDTHSTGQSFARFIHSTGTSVADPDPNPDPYVFVPPGSGSISQRHGSGSFYHNANSKKNLDFYCFVTSF